MSLVVKDRFGAAADPELPSLALALDPLEVKRQFKKGLPRLAGEGGVVRVRRIRVTRYKPGRRCVVEYDVRVERPGVPREATTLIGKIRAGRSGAAAYHEVDAFWRRGFAADASDGISVAEPIAALKEHQMWLQRKVPGKLAAELLAEPGGAALGPRIAEAAHKLHRAGVPARRRHTMADELRILRACLESVAHERPGWAPRLERVLDNCHRVAATTPEPTPVGIHRDFYADQVIVEGSRLHLIDFDLYCLGDPGLDIGNFLGHVTEQSLRELGDPEALTPVENAIEERFVELSGEAVRPSVRAYAALTLARHIYLSMQLRKRRRLTQRLLELCEERLEGQARASFPVRRRSLALRAP